MKGLFNGASLPRLFLREVGMGIKRWCATYLARFAWVRRWYGGHWERCWIDVPGGAPLWLPVERCSYPEGGRPDPLLRGPATCEEYPR